MPVTAQHRAVLCLTARHTLCSRYIAPPSVEPASPPAASGSRRQAGVIASTAAMIVLAAGATVALARVGNPFTEEPEATAVRAALTTPSPAATAPPATALPVLATPPAQSPATPRPSATAARTPTPAATVYVVRPGDSLTSIAAAHGVTVAQLAAANGLPLTARLQVGQRLILPPASR